MGREAGLAGGVTAINSGKITNCCSLVKMRTGGKTSGGFAGENIGEISSSYYSGSLRNLSGGLTGSGKGKINQSYYFHDRPEDSKELARLRDQALARRFDAISKPEDAREIGFDTDDYWQYIGGSQVLLFNSEKWMFDITKSDIYPRCSGTGGIRPEIIRTAGDLIEFAQKINEGNGELASAYVRLEEDIDLGGRIWQPIGGELEKAFSGLFDGNGHTIGNFVVKSNAAKASGLFGYLKGEVYNLNVDCIIKGGSGTAGGVAAHCEGGVIGCCGVVVEISGRTGNLGGITGRNTGTIFHSYAAGAITARAIPWYWFAPLTLLLLALFLIPRLASDNLPIFAPVPQDSNIRPIGDEIIPRTDRNQASFQFERIVDVNLVTGECLFNFANPGTSNHDIVIQLHFTDSQATDVMGSTGRTDEEQQKLYDNPQYDPDNYRTIIAESGAVPPGYQLDVLKLTRHPNGASIPPGEYVATAYLIFYDIETHNRAMMESQFPIILEVHQ